MTTVVIAFQQFGRVVDAASQVFVLLLFRPAFREVVRAVATGPGVGSLLRVRTLRSTGVVFVEVAVEHMAIARLPLPSFLPALAQRQLVAAGRQASPWHLCIKKKVSRMLYSSTSQIGCCALRQGEYENSAGGEADEW